MRGGGRGGGSEVEGRVLSAVAVATPCMSLLQHARMKIGTNQPLLASRERTSEVEDRILVGPNLNGRVEARVPGPLCWRVASGPAWAFLAGLDCRCTGGGLDGAVDRKTRACFRYKV